MSDTTYDDLVESEFIVDSRYNPKDVGLVVGGMVTKGEIVVNSTFYIGPDKNGAFKAVIVKSIQENRVNILSAKRGQTVTI